MHCPDADGEKKCRTRKQQTATGIRCAANPRGEPETSITSQNRDHHRERDEIGIVSFEHDLLGQSSPRKASSRRELIRPSTKMAIRCVGVRVGCWCEPGAGIRSCASLPHAGMTCDKSGAKRP